MSLMSLCSLSAGKPAMTSSGLRSVCHMPIE
jgi:hypothetical protein